MPSDAKVFNPNALSYRGSILSSLYCRQKKKQKKYKQHIHEVEMGCFTPLMFYFPLLIGGISAIAISF